VTDALYNSCVLLYESEGGRDESWVSYYTLMTMMWQSQLPNFCGR